MMQAKPEYRDRDETQVAILDALAEKQDEGMTVLELRVEVDVDIDTLEGALAKLKRDNLIHVEDGEQTVIVVERRVIGPQNPENGTDLFEEIKRRFPF